MSLREGRGVGALRTAPYQGFAPEFKRELASEGIQGVADILVLVGMIPTMMRKTSATFVADGMMMRSSAALCQTVLVMCTRTFHR